MSKKQRKEIKQLKKERIELIRTFMDDIEAWEKVAEQFARQYAWQLFDNIRSGINDED